MYNTLFSSDLSKMEFGGIGCPKAVDIPRLLSHIVYLNWIKHNPNRYLKFSCHIYLNKLINSVFVVILKKLYHFCIFNSGVLNSAQEVIFTRITCWNFQKTCSLTIYRKFFGIIYLISLDNVKPNRAKKSQNQRL